MFYRVAADAVLVLHILFVIFVIAGGVLVFRWRWVALLHLPAVIWVILLEFFGWICPLTPLEIELRLAGAQEAYGGSFIGHYLLPLLYPAELDRNLQFVLGSLLLLLNGIIYGGLLLALRKHGGRNNG